MRADATRASDEGGAHRIPPAIATDFVMTILDGETQALLPRAAPSPPRARVPDPGLAPRASRKPRWAATVTGLVAPALATLLLLGAALAAAGTSPFATRNAALGDAVDDYLHAHVAVPVDGRNAALGVEAHVGSAHGARHARERHHTAAARTTHKPHVRKPRILIAVISWNGGGEEVRALHDTWLPALKDAHPDVEADYAVFVGRPEPARLGGDGAFARTHSSLGRTNNDARARDAVEVDDAPEYTASAGAIGNLIISPDPVAEEKLRRVSDDLDEATRAAEKSREDARAVNASEPSGAAEKAKKSKDSKVSDASEASKDAAKVSDASEASKDAAKDDAAKIGISDSSTDSSTDSEGFPEEHLVRLDVGDAYEDLPAKVIAAVRWAKDAEYDYVYKVDTDVFMLPSKFIAFLKVNAIDKGVDWMGSENKMYRAAPGDVTNSGFVCGLSLDWHFGKCSRPDLNTKPYAGVNPVSVDGGHGYLLSRKAMWAVSDYCFKHEAELERDRYVNIYEDQLLAHILVKQGFLPVDFSGINAFDVPGIDGDKADDACAVLEGEPGKEIGRRVAAMQAYRFESGVNLYETADGWHPKTMDARMLPWSLLRVGIQPYVWANDMLPKWEYYRDRSAIRQQRKDGTYLPVTIPRNLEFNSATAAETSFGEDVPRQGKEEAEEDACVECDPRDPSKDEAEADDHEKDSPATKTDEQEDEDDDRGLVEDAADASEWDSRDDAEAAEFLDEVVDELSDSFDVVDAPRELKVSVEELDETDVPADADVFARVFAEADMYADETFDPKTRAEARAARRPEKETRDDEEKAKTRRSKKVPRRAREEEAAEEDADSTGEDADSTGEKVDGFDGFDGFDEAEAYDEASYDESAVEKARAFADEETHSHDHEHRGHRGHRGHRKHGHRGRHGQHHRQRRGRAHHSGAHHSRAHHSEAHHSRAQKEARDDGPVIAKALPPLDDDEEAYDGAARANAVEKADADEDASSREGASWVGTLEKEKRVDVKTSSFETLLEKAMAKGESAEDAAWSS